MKIAMFCIPAHGHTNPTLGVVRELISRGHEVWYYSYEMMRGKIEAAGAHFVPCDAYDPQMRLSAEDSARIGKDLAFSTELIVRVTLALDDAVIADMQRLAPDVIVGDSMAFWAKLIARKLNIPFVSSTTTFAFNKESSKVMPSSRGSMLSFLTSLRKINKSLDLLREKGYQVGSVLDILQNDQETDTVVYTSREFQPCVETFSSHYTFAGPILRPVDTPLEKSGLPTVYISLGTVDNRHPDFYRNCLAALRDAPCRVIMSVGEGTDIAALGEIPGNINVQNRVDQMAVLAVSDAFVTHCGMNSVSEALYFGVPLLLFPLTPEEQGVANRVSALGAGLFLREDTPDSIRAGIDAVLNADNLRASAKSLGDSFRRCGGAKAAADKIEDTAGKPAHFSQPQPIMTPGQKAQALVGTTALILLLIALFTHGPVRRILLILGAVLGLGSNIFRFLDKGKQ